jgi:hypothetical protein
MKLKTNKFFIKESMKKIKNQKNKDQLEKIIYVKLKLMDGIENK